MTNEEQGASNLTLDNATISIDADKTTPVGPEIGNDDDTGRRRLDDTDSDVD
jgi:hypothetical protein